MSRDGLVGLLPRHIPLSIPPARLNALLQDAVAGQPRIRAASIFCETGSFRLGLTVTFAGLRLGATTQLGLDAFTLSPQRRVISLRRLRSERAHGADPMSRLLALFINRVLSGWLGLDLLAEGLNRVDGITVDRERIDIDLDRMGLSDAIRQAIVTRISEALNERLPGGLARLALQGGIPALAGRLAEAAMDHLQIADIRIDADTGLSGELMLAGLDSVVLPPPGGL